MPVFNIAANTVPARPVDAYYEGKAVRLALKNKELANQEAQQRVDANLPERKAQVTEGNLEYRALEYQRSLDEDSREAITRGANAGTKVVKEGGSVEDANRAFRMAASPEEYDEAIDDGVVIPLDVMEIWASSDEKSYQQADFIDKEGVAQQGAFDPQTGEYVERGMSPIAPQAGQSDINFGGGAGDKTADRKAREVIGGAENLLSSVNRISEQVDEMSQSAMGLPGTVTSFVDNATNAMIGFSQMLGGDAVIGNDVVSDEMLLDVRLYRDKFSGPAADNAALQANSVGLAYALARAANPDGRISDADVRHQLERVKLDKSSKTQIQAAIKEVRREVLVNVSNHLRVGGYTKTEEGQAAYQKYMKQLEEMDAAIVTPEGQKIEDIPSDDLRKSLGIS